MPQVRLSARAQSDLARLRGFLLVKDANAAKRALLALRKEFSQLQHSPLIGRPVEERADLRELVIDFGARGYVAMYRVEPGLDAVTILAIKHQREVDYK